MTKILLDTNAYSEFMTGNTKVLDYIVEAEEIFGEIKSELRSKGKMIPLNDIWIAAHTIETGSKLITYDSHFKHISGLRICSELP